MQTQDAKESWYEAKGKPKRRWFRRGLGITKLHKDMKENNLLDNADTTVRKMSDEYIELMNVNGNLTKVVKKPSDIEVEVLGHIRDVDGNAPSWDGGSGHVGREQRDWEKI